MQVRVRESVHIKPYVTFELQPAQMNRQLAPSQAKEGEWLILTVCEYWRK